MFSPRSREVFKEVLDEASQRHRSRLPALLSLEEALGRRVITYFVSFSDPLAMIEDRDADTVEEALRQFETDDGRPLSLVLNAPGGDGLAAERIVRVCRAYAGGDFEVIVPRMAKSAATMICFGADRLRMSPTSELGPVDPQVSFQDGERTVRMSAREILDSYEALLASAVACGGNVAPYLQLLARYDARTLETYRTAEALSESIAVTLLTASMMRGVAEEEIRARIRPFLETKQTRSHARAIYPDRAAACGLRIEVLDLQSELWQLVWELYLRSSYAVDNAAHSKLIEIASHSFVAAPKEGVAA